MIKEDMHRESVQSGISEQVDAFGRQTNVDSAANILDKIEELTIEAEKSG